MLLHLSDSVHRGVSVPACITGHITGGVSVQGVSVQGWSLSRRVSVRETAPDRDPPNGNKRAVCILPECILVMILHLSSETVTISAR